MQFGNGFKKNLLLAAVVAALCCFCIGQSVFADGSIIGWGSQVVGVDLSRGFVKVAAGYYHSLGLKQDGSIVAWGDNGSGECNIPSPNSGFIAIAAGYWYSLGLKQDGSIVAWGDNWYGQCNIPSPNSGFIAIAAGGWHSLGLKQDGSIVAWGYNGSGQCNIPEPNSGFIAISACEEHSLGLKQDGSIVAWGNNDYGQCNIPSPNSGFIAISAGGEHSLGLKQDGSIVAWGYNWDGECNIPSPNSGFIAISAGYGHSLGLKQDGSIVAWGSNYDYGGNWVGQATPPQGNDFIAIAAGGYHSLGLKQDGSIVTWGNNGDGQCNIPSPNSGFIAISAGEYHSLGLKQDGSIVAWGNNDDGQCNIPSPNSGFIAIAAGWAHSLGLKQDGSIVGWGKNDYGQADPCDANNFVAIAAGGYHSLALKSDGSIVGWGWNDYSQATPPVGSNFVAIAAGGSHSLAIARNDLNISITKCTVTAGGKDNSDAISISGLMSATADDFNDANNIQVTINSNDMVKPCVQNFPKDEKSFKKGKYNYARTENASKRLFKYDTKNRKFTFMAKNIDLSGLACPLTVQIIIGDDTGEAEVNEAIVNGPKKPIPIKLMMGVKNALRVDKYKVKCGKKPNTDQLSVKGGFAVADTGVNLAAVDFVVGLAGQTWTIPAGSFTEKNWVFTCKNVGLSGSEIANASLNLNTCVFTMRIKNTKITAGSGAANFSVQFADFDESVQIVLP